MDGVMKTLDLLSIFENRQHTVIAQAYATLYVIVYFFC